MEESTNTQENSARQTLLSRLLNTENQVLESARSDIVCSPPLITKNVVPIISRGTINVIQGKQGSHKSRLAEHFASLLLSSDSERPLSIGFEKEPDSEVTVVYLDTERSKTEELPLAIKSIIANAGFEMSKGVNNFRFTSIKDIPRNSRLEALKLFVQEIRKSTSNPIFAIVDVGTDGIENFNDPVESMKLLDFLGKLCDESDATVLMVIHENPGGEKPRGHLGTEAVNKASTVMQIGFERGANNLVTNHLSLKFVKQRHSEKLPPIPLAFDSETKSLKLVDSNIFASINSERNRKITTEAVIGLLQRCEEQTFKQQELLGLLIKELGCAENTAKSRLNEIADKKLEIRSEFCTPCILKITVVPGNPTIYELMGFQKIG